VIVRSCQGIKMKQLLTSVIAAMALAGGSVIAAESSGNYATDLARVFGGYQRILALKEACDTAVPVARASNNKAFSAWEAQHRTLLQDLRQRVDAMIRGASKDREDYVRNLGKYEGEILLQRKEYRDMLLALGADDLRGQCQRVPETLKGPEANLAAVYASELQTIRKRK
jgi:hypothetical protein